MTPATPHRYRIAWGLFRRHWRAFVVVELAILAAWVALEAMVIAAHRAGLPVAIGIPLWGVLHLVFLWFACSLLAGLHAMALCAVDGGAPGWRMGFARFDRGHVYFLASTLYWASVAVGLVLLVVPGLVFAVRWNLFRWVIVETRSTPVAALRSAALLSARCRWPLLRVIVNATLLDLAGAALLGVGLLMAFPITLLARAVHFRTVEQAVGCAPVSLPDAPRPPAGQGPGRDGPAHGKLL
jgi:hypothetical protein